MQSDAFRCIGTRSGIFGNFWIFEILRMIFGRVESVGQHLFGELELRLLIEVFVETDEWAPVLQVVARELHFSQRRDLLD